MATLAFALPTLPEGTHALRRLAGELLGPRRAEFDDFNRRLGFTTHNCYLQQTAQGQLAIVYLEGAELGRAFQTLAQSQHPFDQWFMDQAKLVHGVDFREPFPGPLPEVAFESGAGGG